MSLNRNPFLGEMYRNTTNQIDNCLSKITGLNHKIAKLQQEIDFKEPTAEEKIKLEEEWDAKYRFKKRKRKFKLQKVLTSEQRNEHKEEIQLAKNEVENLTTVLKQLKKERDDFKTKINFEEIKELKVRLEELTGIFTKDDFYETAKKAAQTTPSNKSYNYLIQAIKSKSFEAFTSEKILDKNGKQRINYIPTNLLKSTSNSKKNE